MDDLAPLFARLGRSAFRSRFQLNAKEQAYLAERGLDTILAHGLRLHRPAVGAGPAAQ
ncbi:DUF4186 family protein [Sphingobium xenophagum]|uniref:DUF4186 family protein n=1 Tax=Sphingobium xenophagum TaxID=121428 RepID=UPI0023EA4CBA|nr:DUF4186 family protein [Sphingobium xenophagum]